MIQSTWKLILPTLLWQFVSSLWLLEKIDVPSITQLTYPVVLLSLIQGFPWHRYAHQRCTVWRRNAKGTQNCNENKSSQKRDRSYTNNVLFLQGIFHRNSQKVEFHFVSFCLITEKVFTNGYQTEKSIMSPSRPATIHTCMCCS